MLQEAADHAIKAEKHSRQRQSWLARKSKLKEQLAEARRQLSEARHQLDKARQQIAFLQSSAVEADAEAVCRGTTSAVKQVRSDISGVYV